MITKLRPVSNIGTAILTFSDNYNFGRNHRFSYFPLSAEATLSATASVSFVVLG